MLLLLMGCERDESADLSVDEACLAILTESIAIPQRYCSIKQPVCDLLFAGPISSILKIIVCFNHFGPGNGSQAASAIRTLFLLLFFLLLSDFRSPWAPPFLD